MNGRFIRNLCITAFITFVMVAVISVGFAYMAGNFNVMAVTMDNNGIGASIQKAENRKSGPLESEPILQSADLKSKTKAILPDLGSEPVMVSINRPNYGASASVGISHISPNLCINEEFRLSLVEYNDANLAYLHINQVSPMITSMAYSIDSGLGDDKVCKGMVPAQPA